MNKRSFLRAPVFLDGLLCSQGTTVNIGILNISEGGALISSISPLSLKSQSSLILELYKLPQIKQLHYSSEQLRRRSEFVRVSSCSLINLRDINNIGSHETYTYSMCFRNISIEAARKISQYIDDSKQIVEYLLSLKSQESDSRNLHFDTLVNDLEWFDHKANIDKQLNCFYQDLCWQA